MNFQIMIRALVSAVILSGGCAGEPADLLVRDVLALDDGTAVVHTEDQKTQVHSIARMVSGRTVWSTELPGEPLKFGVQGMSVHKGIVGVRQVHNGFVPFVGMTGLSLGTGDPQWNATLKSFPGQRFTPELGKDPSLGSFATQAAFFEFVNDNAGRADELLAIDADTGAVVRRALSDDMHSAPIVVGPYLVVHSFGTASVFGGSAAEPMMVPVEGVGCVADGEFARVIPTTHGFQLVAWPEMDPTRASTVDLEIPPDAHKRIVGCARYGKQIVVERTDLKTTELHIMTPAGRSQGVVTLAGWRDSHTEQRFPAAAAVGGALPRYVPYDVDTADGHQLWLIDLERRTVARKLPFRDVESIFQVDGRWYLVAYGQTIAAIDGDDGRFVGAVRVQGVRYLRPIDPTSIAGGSLWIAGYGQSASEGVAIARLDARSLAPTFASPAIQIVDVSDDCEWAPLR